MRPGASVAVAGHRGRDLLRAARRHSVADAAALLPSAPDGPWLVRPLAGSPARPPVRLASLSIRGAGWSNGASPGSAATAASPATSRPPSPPPPPSSTPLPSCSSRGGSLVPHEFRVGL